MPAESVMIIARGDLPSLTAAAIQSEPGRLIFWHLREPGQAAERRREAVEACAEVLGVASIVHAEQPTGDATGAAPGALSQALMLLQAAIGARQLECAKIIWPIAVGPDHQKVGDVVERANLVMALAEQPAGGDGGETAFAGPVMIDLPLVDLTAGQMVDLLDDAGGPMGAFWPCEGGGREPCGRCAECRTWAGAFAELGLEWPWAVAAPA